MARRPAEYRKVHKKADRIEPRVERAIHRFADRLSKRVKVGAFAQAIAAKDTRATAQLIAELDVEDALQPSVAILHDAFQQGGKIGAEEVDGFEDG